MWNQPKITCPICGVRFRLPLGFTGGMIRCPGCWRVVNMPSPITLTTPPAWWVTRAWDWVDSWRRPPDPAKSAGFLETRQWALDYNPPREGEDYTLALEYAEKRYEEMQNLSEALDKKLEGLARTSLAIGVLIATVARALGSNTPLGRSPLLIWKDARVGADSSECTQVVRASAAAPTSLDRRAVMVSAKRGRWFSRGGGKASSQCTLLR